MLRAVLSHSGRAVPCLCCFSALGSDMGSDPSRTARDDFACSLASKHPVSDCPGKLSSLIGLLTYCGCCLLAAQVYAQQTDQFITTIEKIKTGIAPVACARAAAPINFDVGIHGTAFFIDPHGAFLTAAHVIKGIVENKDKCEMPAVLIRLDGSSFEILNLYGLKFVASDCRIDGTADIARCKTIEDPSKAGKIVIKPTALEIASDVRPDGTAVAFSGFPVNGLIPYTARANIAGYQVVEMDPNRDQLRMLVLDKPAWPGSSGGPVYGVNGCVVGMLLQTGIGLAFARPGARLNEFVSSR